MFLKRLFQSGLSELSHRLILTPPRSREAEGSVARQWPVLSELGVQYTLSYSNILLKVACKSHYRLYRLGHNHVRHNSTALGVYTYRRERVP